MTSDLIQKSLPNILEHARYAPSVHNTQPWLVSTEHNAIIINLDPRYALGPGDPTGRETMLSMGIFAEAVILATESLGLKLSSLKLEGKSVKLNFNEIARPARANEGLLKLLHQRCTDRSLYTPVDIGQDIVKQLQATAQTRDVQVFVVVDRAIIETIAQLTARGINLALSNPEFRRELSRYLLLPISRRKRGIAVKSLRIDNVLEWLQPWTVRFGIGLGVEAKHELERWLSSSAAVVITANGDLQQHWFNAGRTYLHASLAIERLGLSQATNAASVEASNYHEDIEQLLGTTQRIQAMIRIGKGSPQRVYSPRVSASSLLTSP
jgi:hypothetical protein